MESLRLRLITCCGASARGASARSSSRAWWMRPARCVSWKGARGRPRMVHFSLPTKIRFLPQNEIFAQTPQMFAQTPQSLPTKSLRARSLHRNVCNFSDTIPTFPWLRHITPPPLTAARPTRPAPSAPPLPPTASARLATSSTAPLRRQKPCTEPPPHDVQGPANPLHSLPRPTIRCPDTAILCPDPPFFAESLPFFAHTPPVLCPDPPLSPFLPLIVEQSYQNTVIT